MRLFKHGLALWAITLSINVPDNAVSVSTTAYCNYYNYTDNALPGETPGQFTKRMIVQGIKNFIANYQAGAISHQTQQDTFNSVSAQVGGIQ